MENQTKSKEEENLKARKANELIVTGENKTQKYMDQPDRAQVDSLPKYNQRKLRVKWLPSST